MKTRESRRLGTVLGLGAALLLSLALLGNTDGTCAPVDPQAFCAADSECGGVPPVDCVGEWACQDGACVFECEDPSLPPDGCTTDADCAAGEVCGFDDLAECCPAEAWCLMYLPVCEGVCLPAPPPPPAGCWSDADCAPGEYCAWDPSLPCAAPDCGEDADCAAGLWACGGVCLPVEPPPVECWSDADCGDGMRCERPADCTGECPQEMGCDWICGGVCVPVEPPPVECWSDADCAPGEYCQVDDWCWNGAGCDEAGNCGADRVAWCGGVCVPVEPPPVECWTDADCAPGFRCETDPACAVPDCAPGQECGEGIWYCGGVCVPVEPPPVECWNNEDCPAGMACEFLYDCQQPWCPDGDCDEPFWGCPGQCVWVQPPPAECWSDADCGAGMRCEFQDWCAYEDGCDAAGDCGDPALWCGGVCVPDDPPPAGCQADWDCAADERCQLDWSGCDASCGPDGNCLPCAGRCVPIKECLSDGDCPGGTVCDFSAAYCADWDCAPGYDCVPPPCVGVCREPDFGWQA